MPWLDDVRRWLAVRLAPRDTARLLDSPRSWASEPLKREESEPVADALRAEVAAARHDAERARDECDSATRALAESREALAAAARDLETSRTSRVSADETLAEIRRALEASREEGKRLAEQLAAAERERHAAEGDGDEGSRRNARGGGRRVSELEARVRDLEAHAARLLGRAEDAERELARTSERDRAADVPGPPRRDATSPRHSEGSRRPDRRAEPERSRAVDNTIRGSLAEVWWSPGDDCLEAIYRRIDDADRRIDVCVFTITDDRLAQALLAAHRRGVAIRVITDNDKAEDEGSDVHRLHRAGLEVRVDRTEYHMHHKFAVFDGRYALTGSYNWTRGAARNNEEHIVVTDDPRLVEPLASGFERLWRSLGPEPSRSARRES